ncbi:hypothetical protein BIV23_07260 [Streptomyces monashensis]|uniref:Uncharacterized protein n=1 Tax=Streptomyces monashensis TaxID=1678012 RepID=A0A1S2QL06_9ACTN|nr:hypothetical protein BIV23_07260 [Streptomyces monashensis]
MFVGLAGGGFDAETGGDASDEDLGDAEPVEMVGEVGAVERSPGVCGDGLVAGLLVECGEQVGEAVGQVAGVVALLGAAGGGAGDVDQHNRQSLGTEGVGQRRGVRDDVAERVHGRQAGQPCLQVDDDECGGGVKDGDRHWALRDLLDSVRQVLYVAAVSVRVAGTASDRRHS